MASNRQIGGAWPFGLSQVECLAHHLGHGSRREYGVGPFRDRLEHRLEVHDLVRFFVDPIEPDLGGDRHQWAGVGLGVGNAQQQIDGPWPQRGGADSSLACEAAVDVGHKRRALLVSSQDEADLFRSRYSSDELDVLLSGDAENVLDPFILQARHNKLGNIAHRGHENSLKVGWARTTLRRSVQIEQKGAHRHDGEHGTEKQR